MKYNCNYCKKYWAVFNEPYFSDLKSKKQEATKEVTVFCPACRMSKVRKDRWDRQFEDS